MYRFDEGHTAPRPQFLDPPAAAKQRSRPLVGLVALAATAVIAGVWLGVAAAIAWRVFQWMK